MKKIYMKPELEVISTKTERLLKTDSVGWDDPSLAGAKEDFNDSFDTEDNLWDYSTKKDIWK
jgi:hypothetical protein